MVQFDLPEAGLTLTQPLMSNTHSIPEGKNPQIMQLDLEASLLRDVLRSARQGGKGVNVTFGKKIVGCHAAYVSLHVHMLKESGSSLW